MLEKNIVLIGYRGTGKSVIGKRLAEILQAPFYDTDELIEAAAGKSIREMVAEGGWEHFRKKEREIVNKVAGLQGCIIATGGGAVMDEGNADVLKRQGVFIWLSADVETIVERIRNDLGSEERRPSFSHDDIFRETEEVLEKRIPVYSRLADLSVQTAGEDIEEVVASILRFLGMESIDNGG